MQKIEFKDVTPNFVEGSKQKDKPYSELIEFLEYFVKNSHYKKGKILAYNVTSVDDILNILFKGFKETMFDIQLTQEQENKINDSLTILQNIYDKNKNINLENILTFLLGSVITMYQPFYENNHNTDQK
jgi:hypothetical protein